jgi:hypothetical protein
MGGKARKVKEMRGVSRPDRGGFREIPEKEVQTGFSFHMKKILFRHVRAAVMLLEARILAQRTRREPCDRRHPWRPSVPAADDGPQPFS